MHTLKTVVISAVVALVAASGAARAQQPSTLAPEDYVAIQQLVARYPYALDTGEEKGHAYANLFAEDGEFVSPVATITGRASLAEFANGHRPGQGPLLVRNFATNLLIQPAPNGATGKQYGVVINLGENGEPSSIFAGGHFEDVYVKTSDGWRIKRREFVPSRGEAR